MSNNINHKKILKSINKKISKRNLQSKIERLINHNQELKEFIKELKNERLAFKKENEDLKKKKKDLKIEIKERNCYFSEFHKFLDTKYKNIYSEFVKEFSQQDSFKKLGFSLDDEFSSNIEIIEISDNEIELPEIIELE
ncbi:3439_t:CDS:1 [Scutellospora calospora]|uniref:3439_t:CDS:1 n=1 Tax=Scutellospora calospora TaxID=85575 RepID=A0ACA9MC27_9GLOM|nr:3439_t:CDS:1 [Scutellospora calospora]